MTFDAVGDVGDGDGCQVGLAVGDGDGSKVGFAVGLVVVGRLVGKMSMPDRDDAVIDASDSAADDDAAATFPFIMAFFSASRLARSDLPFRRALSIMRIMKRSVEHMARRNIILWQSLWVAGGMFVLDRLGCTYSYACSAGRLS